MGLWSALNVGRTGLEASQLAMEVAGHNIANAATPGYSRQRAVLAANAPRDAGGLLAGTGVRVQDIQAAVDRHLEERVRSAAADAADLDARHTYLTRVETIFNEFGDGALSASLNEFFNAMQDLQASPDDHALRQILAQRTTNLANAFTRIRGRLDDARAEIDATIVADVGQVNRLAHSIAALNERIVIQEQGGVAGQANDLRDQRAVLLGNLTQLVGARVIEEDSGQVNVFLGSDALVQNTRVNDLTTARDADRGVARSQVVFALSGRPATIAGGAVAGLIASRDVVVVGAVDDLDAMARALIGQINRVHSAGQGLEPFSALTGGAQVSDPAAPLNAAGLPFTPGHGRFNVTVVASDTGVTTTTAIDVDLDGLGADTSLNDLAAQLDAVDGISAHVDGRRRLVIEADSDQVGFTFGDDSSGVLAALGINGLFDGHDSRTIALASPVAGDVSMIAAGRSGNPGDGSNLAALLALRDAPVAGLDGLSLPDFLQSTTSTLAVQTASAKDAATAARTFAGTLRAERESQSGVSLDEEAANLIQFERLFQASARLISAVDEMMRTLLAM